MKMIILRSPVEIRSLLYEISYKSTCWEEFMKRASELTWLITTNESSHRTTDDIKQPTPTTAKQSSNKFESNIELKSKTSRHIRKYERNIKSIAKTGQTSKKSIQVGCALKPNTYKPTGSQKDSKGGVINKGIYSVYEPEHVENIFNQRCQIGNRQTRCLIDTGADISLIHISELPKDEPIHKVRREMQIKSATGDRIKIIGCVNKLLIKMNNVKYHLDAYVTNSKPAYTILGVKFILQNPEVLINLLPNHDTTKNIKKTSNAKVNVITEEENILNKYPFLFKDEISDYSLCTTATHRIETGNALPFKHLNQRIPVHWETQ
ncbi:MAG: retropepsin-like aspartic protease, partial [Aeromonas sp.]